jgi:ribonuclease HI
VSGVGVFFGPGDARNASERPPPPHTNQRAELRAVLRALEIARDEPCTLRVHTDSAYAIGCAVTWSAGWRSRGWRKADNKPVENLDLVKSVYSEVADRRKRFGLAALQMVKVKGHSGVPGNEAADALATAAAARRASPLPSPAPLRSRRRTCADAARTDAPGADRDRDDDHDPADHDHDRDHDHDPVGPIAAKRRAPPTE